MDIVASICKALNENNDPVFSMEDPDDIVMNMLHLYNALTQMPEKTHIVGPLDDLRRLMKRTATFKRTGKITESDEIYLPGIPDPEKLDWYSDSRDQVDSLKDAINTAFAPIKQDTVIPLSDEAVTAARQLSITATLYAKWQRTNKIQITLRKNPFRYYVLFLKKLFDKKEPACSLVYTKLKTILRDVTISLRNAKGH